MSIHRYNSSNSKCKAGKNRRNHDKGEDVGRAKNEPMKKMPQSVVEVREYNKAFDNLNFGNPLIDDINETPIPMGLKRPKVTRILVLEIQMITSRTSSGSSR